MITLKTRNYISEDFVPLSEAIEVGLEYLEATEQVNTKAFEDLANLKNFIDEHLNSQKVHKNSERQ